MQLHPLSGFISDFSGDEMPENPVSSTQSPVSKCLSSLIQRERRQTPVTKSMELLPLGPVVIIDTPGFDDEGSLGKQRIKRARQILNRADCAVLVVDGTEGIGASDQELLDLFKEKDLPFLIVFNKCDLSAFQNSKKHDLPATDTEISGTGISGAEIPNANIEGTNILPANILSVSAQKNIGIQELKERIASLVHTGKPTRNPIRDLLHPGRSRDSGHPDR